MKTRPLDENDLNGLRQSVGLPQHPLFGEAWFWCRVHERGEHIGWTMVGCARIGPFMSEAEAEKCTGLTMDWEGDGD